MNSNPTIAIISLGYVGLPLAVEFGKHFQTIGFDLSAAKMTAHNASNAAIRPAKYQSTTCAQR